MTEKIEYVGDFFYNTQKGINSKTDDYVSPEEKKELTVKDELLTVKAEERQQTCWVCERTPTVWVREIQFDLKAPDARIDQATINSAHYEGPVPGFCFGHLATDAVAGLAQWAWVTDEAIFWGYRPTRWAVVFTDGTRTGGLCTDIDLYEQLPTHSEIYAPGGDTSKQIVTHSNV